MLLRPIARSLLAASFVQEGLDTARRPERHVEAARVPADRLSGLVGSGVPLTDSQLTSAVRTHGALTLAAGAALALGKAPRTAALLLAVLTVPLAIADAPFSSDDRPERPALFARRLTAIGAALLAGLDREGRPGFAWRVEHARKKAGH